MDFENECCFGRVGAGLSGLKSTTSEMVDSGSPTSDSFSQIKPRHTVKNANGGSTKHGASMKDPSLKQRFDRDGYLLDLPLLTHSQVNHARRAYERLEAETIRRNPKGRITNAHHSDPEFWNLATGHRVMELVETLIGPNIVLLSTGFFAKAPNTDEKFVAWHQDTTYWGLEPPFAVTVWIAIDDSTIENGCMRVIPGSHHKGLLPHGTSDREGNVLGQNQEIDPSLFDSSTAVDFVLKAGRSSVHHGLLIHGSNPNCSSRRRVGMTARFCTPDVKPVKDGPYPFVDRALLVHGEDRFDHFDYAPTPAFATS